MPSPLYKLIAVNNSNGAIELEQLALTLPSGSQVDLTEFNTIDEIHSDQFLIEQVISGNILMSASLSTVDGTPSETALYDTTGSINLLRFLVTPQDVAFEVTSAVAFTSGTVADAGKLIRLDDVGFLDIADSLGNVLTDTDISGATPGFVIKNGPNSYDAYKAEFSGTAAPTTGDDGSSGFRVGSRWIDVTNQEEYVLFDAATGSAVWVKTSAQDHGELEGLLDNDHPQYYHVSGTNPIAADINMNSTFKVVNLPTPTVDGDAVPKSYVDDLVNGLDWKNSVVLCVSGNFSLTGAVVADGVAVTTGQRILVKAQTNAAENGIYIASTTGSWFRSPDADEDDEVTSQMAVFVESGSTKANTGWTISSQDPITVGTTDINFTQFNGAGSIIAGDGLIKEGNTIHVSGNVDGSIIVNPNDIQVGVLATDAQHGDRGGGSLHAVATTTVNGFLSSSDKAKLDSLNDGTDYLLLDGTRPMSGTFDLGTNNVTNGGTYNGVTVELHGSRHISGAADPIDGDKLDIDFTPSIYTPDTTPAEVDTDEELTAHLAGIDTKLGEISASFTSSLVSSVTPVSDDSLVRYDGTTGLIVQQSTVLVDDSGNVTVTGSLSVSGTINGIRHYPASATDPTVPAPATGDRYYNTVLETDMRYDGTRGKWLSVDSITVQAGRKGNTANGSFYRMTDGLVMTIDDIGLNVPKGTITRIGASRAGTNGVSVLEVLSGGAVIANLSMSAGPSINSDENIDADIDASGIISIRNKSGLSRTRDVQITVTMKRRA